MTRTRSPASSGLGRSMNSGVVEEYAHITGRKAEGGPRRTETEDSLPRPLAPMMEADDTGVIALALKNSDTAVSTLTEPRSASSVSGPALVYFDRLPTLN